MALKWILWDDDDLASFIRREIHSKNTIEKIIIDIEREINVPSAISFDEIRKLIGDMLMERRIMTENIFVSKQTPQPSISEAEIKKMCQDNMLSLRQELHESISQYQVEFGNKWENRLKTIEKELQNSAGTVSTVTPNVDLSSLPNAVKQIQAEQQRLSLRLGQLDNKTRTQSQGISTGDTSQLQAQLNAQAQEIEGLKRSLLLQSQNNDWLRQENQTLKQQAAQREQRITNLESQYGTQAQQLSDLKQQVEKLIHGTVVPTPTSITTSTSRISTTPLKPTIPKAIPASPFNEKPTAQPTTTSVSVSQSHAVQAQLQTTDVKKPTKEYWISSSALSKPMVQKAYFCGDGDMVKAKLTQSIQKMDELITDLSLSKIAEPAKTSFMKNLRWGMEALEKLYSKFDFDGCDPEDISEEITDKFFKIISENILDNVMVAIYRGGKDAVGYNEFLGKVNHYLAAHDIYTREILPGSKAEGNIISDIEPPVSKRTDVAADDGKIDEVELLPYFMIYENDDGNVETVRKRGRIVRLKYGA